MSRHAFFPFFLEILLFLLIWSSTGLLIDVYPQKAHAGAGGIGEGSPPCPPPFQCYGLCPAGNTLSGSPDTFVKGPFMAAPRAFFASTALQLDNKIPLSIDNQNCAGPLGAFRFGLVAGGIDAQGNVTPTAELFGPLIYGANLSGNQPTALYEMGFDPTGTMTTPRVMHQATLFSFTFVPGSSGFSVSGQALITGGSRNLAAGPHSTSALSSAEIFTFGASWPASNPNAPAEGQFSTAAHMKVARTLHQATLLLNGKVLITGGLNGKREVLASAEIYDPSTGTFTLTKRNMKHARFGHTATLLPDGSVLITGGESNGAGYPNLSGQSALKTAEIYNPAFRTFKEVGPMKFARAGHTASLIACPSSVAGCPGQNAVLIAGGITPKGVTASAELYTPGGSFSSVQNMTTPRFLHTASSIPGSAGQILIAGGTSDAELRTSLDTAERFDPSTNAFVATSEPMLAARRDFSVGTPTPPIVLSDFIILTGGEDSSGTSQATTDYYLPPLQEP